MNSNRPLLERDAQLAQLREYMDQAIQSEGRLVLVGGSAGIGKSSLVRAFCRSVEDDVQVLIGTCDALATQNPLGPLFDIAAAIGPQANALTVETGSQIARFRAFLDLLSAPLQPSLVVFEDLHWADEATLDLLRFIGRRIDTCHAMLIATYRDDEIGPEHPLRILLGDLATLAAGRRISVPALSEAAVETLATGSEIDPIELFRLTAGNPFFVTEVLAADIAGIPPTVRDAVLARAARLSPAGREALEMAATVGSPAELALLELSLAPDPGAIDECIAAGMLVASGETYRFRHEIARQSIIETLAPQHRAGLHRRVLEALESGPVDRSKLARLAHHAEESGQWQSVLHYAPNAARDAAQLSAHREAAAQFRRALRVADRIEDEARASLLEEYAHECYLTDQMDEAIEARRKALTIWRNLRRPLKEGENLYCLARVLVLSGRNAEAEEASRIAISVLESEAPGPELASAYQIQAHLRMLNRDTQEAIAQGLKAIGLAKQSGAREALIYAHNTVGSAMMLSNENEGRTFLERSAQMARDAGLDDYVAAALGNLATASGEIYLFEQADRYLEEGIDFCADRDLDFELHYMRSWQAISHMHQGRWTQASDVALELLRLPNLAAISGIMARVALGRVRARRGDPQAEEVLNKALDSALQTATLQRLGPVYAARAEAAWLRGDSGQTKREATAVFDLAESQRHNWFIGELAYWRWKVGDLDELPEHIAEPYELQIRGNWESAARLWDELNCPYERARALAESRNITALRDAFSIFDALDARPAADSTAEQLRELGEPSVPRGMRPTTRANPAGLTQRQMEVAELIADGLPNAEIAARLFISPKTVEHHITAIFGKLQVTNRTAAIEELQRIEEGVPKLGGRSA